VSLAAVLAIASGVTHFAAYLAYAIGVMRKEIEGNPLTWLMFMYGTCLMTVLEFSAHAPWTELVLPTTCAISSVLIAAMVMKPGAWRGLKPIDFLAFATDIVLTIAYVAAWLATRGGDLTPAQMTTWLGVFLVTANASTAVQFAPILRSTWAQPQSERVLPWLLWTCAYAILLAVTLLETPGNFALIVYPLTAVVLHALMVSCCLLGARRRYSPASFRA
jgi:hypothetical protein